MTNWFQDHPTISAIIMSVSAVGFVLSMWDLKRIMRRVVHRETSQEFGQEESWTNGRSGTRASFGHTASEYFKASVLGWQGWVTLAVWLVFGLAMARVTKGLPERAFIVVPPFLFAAIILIHKLSDRKK